MKMGIAPSFVLTVSQGKNNVALSEFEGLQIGSLVRPAEITDYRAMGVAPLILAGALAAGAVASLWLTLAASVRRRRADLALLKTLGLTRRQLAATVRSGHDISGGAERAGVCE